MSATKGGARERLAAAGHAAGVGAARGRAGAARPAPHGTCGRCGGGGRAGAPVRGDSPKSRNCFIESGEGEKRE